MTNQRVQASAPAGAAAAKLGPFAYLLAPFRWACPSADVQNDPPPVPPVRVSTSRSLPEPATEKDGRERSYELGDDEGRDPGVRYSREGI